MLDSSEFKYEPYKDGRVVNRPGFTVGMSGPLLMATHKITGKKYIVKHTCPHNAANEYVACWLAERMGVPAPKAYLLSPNRTFTTKYAVAIEYLDGLRNFKTENLSEEMKRDLISQFALCLLAATPIIFVFTKAFAKRVRPLHIHQRECLSKLNTAAQENIAGNRVVKAFAREDYEIDRFDEKNQVFREANKKSVMMWLKFAPYIDGLSQALSVTVLLVGGLFLIQGRISIGTFTLFNSLTWTLSNPMRMLGFLVNDLQRFFASAAKVVELYYARSTIVTRSDAVKKEERVEGAIRFDHVDLKLGGTQILKDIDLDIKPGETIAIMGPTGSGKTSLVNLIPRLTDVSAGEIRVDGIPVGMYDLKKLRGSIGIATQDVFLFSDSVDGNIAYGDPEMSEEEVQRFAKAACVDFAAKLPDGFDTVIGERGTGLSGGQKQRIALARALAVKPSILILDDTTSAVDMETEKYIQEQLANLEFTCTKVIVAQRISTTKRADRVVIIENGRISDIGTHEELISRPGYYREVYELQNGIAGEGGVA